MNYCVSQACTLAVPFADDVAGYADGGCTAVEVWLTKLETHLQTATVADTHALLAERGTTLAAAAYQGGLLLSQGDARRAAFDLFKRRLELCQEFRIPTLLVAADYSAKPDATQFGRALVSLVEAARWAAGFGVRLALEFRTGGFCTCLDTALALVEQAGEPNLGVCLDAFYYATGPSKPDDLARLTPANLAHVQLCDVAGIPRELAGDADRIFPGEGDFPVEPIAAAVRRIGYEGFISFESLNPTLGRSRPSQVAELALASLRRALGS